MISVESESAIPVATSSRYGLFSWSSTHRKVDFFSRGTFGILKRRAPFGTRNGLSLLAVTIVSLVQFWVRRRKLSRAMSQVHASEAAMLNSLAHFTEGFQEIRLNADKSDALQRSFLYSRADTIYGGSNQIQRNVIGERALGLPKEPK